MAKKKSENPGNEAKLYDYSSLASCTGGQILSEIDRVDYFIDTGCLALNWMCSGKFIGGGTPGGKITEIFGPSSSGKSYWGTNILKGTQDINGVAVYLDCENALNAEFAKKSSHIDIDRVIRFTPDCLEAAFKRIFNFMTKARSMVPLEKPIVFIYDSLSASPSERELRETEVPENCSPAEWKRIVGGKEQPGERAKICSREFRKLEAILEKNNATLFVINQIRQKFVMFGDNTTTSGGLALEFYAGCRIRTSPSKRIENSKGAIIGVKLKAKCVKNRSSAPFKEAEDIQLYFDQGINPISGLLGVMTQIERIKLVKGTTYSVCEPWANGKEITFKATKELNMIPVEVLLEAPKLIDASSREEVENYLLPFADSIAQSFGTDNVEKDMNEETKMLCEGFGDED